MSLNQLILINLKCFLITEISAGVRTVQYFFCHFSLLQRIQATNIHKIVYVYTGYYQHLDSTFKHIYLGDVFTSYLPRVNT